jgi:hypothetical protein
VVKGHRWRCPKFFFLPPLGMATATARRQLYLHELSSAFVHLLRRCPSNKYEKESNDWRQELRWTSRHNCGRQNANLWTKITDQMAFRTFVRDGITTTERSCHVSTCMGQFWDRFNNFTSDWISCCIVVSNLDTIYDCFWVLCSVILQMSFTNELSDVLVNWHCNTGRNNMAPVKK